MVYPGKPGIGREGRQVLEQFTDADKNIRNETGRALQNIQDFFSGKNVSDKQLRENIDAGAKEAGRQLEQGAESAKVLWDLLRGHDDGMNPIWEGVKGEEKWFRDTGAKIDSSYKGSDIYKEAKQLEGAGKKVGDALGKAGKDVGGGLSDAGDAAGKAADKAGDWVSNTAQQGQDAASDAGSSAADTVCDWFGC